MLRVACRLAVLILLSPGAAAAQGPVQPPDTSRLQRLLTAEDARGTGPDGLTPLLDARSSPDTLLRRIAVRGLGRMQRPALGRLLAPLLRDSVPAVRAEAATAIAQSMRRVPRTGSAEADSAGVHHQGRGARPDRSAGRGVRPGRARRPGAVAGPARAARQRGGARGRSGGAGRARAHPESGRGSRVVHPRPGAQGHRRPRARSPSPCSGRRRSPRPTRWCGGSRCAPWPPRAGSTAPPPSAPCAIGTTSRGA